MLDTETRQYFEHIDRTFAKPGDFSRTFSLLVRLLAWLSRSLLTLASLHKWSRSRLWLSLDPSVIVVDAFMFPLKGENPYY